MTMRSSLFPMQDFYSNRGLQIYIETKRVSCHLVLHIPMKMLCSLSEFLIIWYNTLCPNNCLTCTVGCI